MEERIDRKHLRQRRNYHEEVFCTIHRARTKKARQVVKRGGGQCGVGRSPEPILIRSRHETTLGWESSSRPFRTFFLSAILRSQALVATRAGSVDQKSTATGMFL